MPTRDLRSNIANDLAFSYPFVANGTQAGQIVDTADYDGGIMFSLVSPSWLEGVYTPLIEESDDSGMAGATTVPATSLIGTIADATVTAQTAVGGSIGTVGFNCVKRYVRLSVVATGITTGGATVFGITTKTPEIKPVV